MDAEWESGKAGELEVALERATSGPDVCDVSVAWSDKLNAMISFAEADHLVIR